MNRSKLLLSVLGLVGVLGVSGYGSNAVAQLQIGGRQANFGSRRVRPGFVPDPIRINVISGGGIDARSLGLGPGCVGWVTARPDFIMNLTGPSSSLRVYAVSSEDVTLLVNTANGSWSCNDDSYGGTNPTVNLPGAQRGQYDIWVGSYRQGVQARAQLNITELDYHP